jgi:outer membrane protein OmpA-like peptidoglycan-associated protein
MPSIVRKPSETTREAVEAIRPREPRRENWTFPVAAVLAALGIAGLIWWSIDASRHRQLARMNAENTAPSAIGTTGTVIPPPSRALPAAPNFTFLAGSIEDRLSRYLASAGSGSMKVDLDRVEFESGSSTLTPKSRAQVDSIAAILRTYPKATIAVAGHTDKVGSETANVALSQARADTVAKALTNSGVAADRIRVEGYGSQTCG